MAQGATPDDAPATKQPSREGPLPGAGEGLILVGIDTGGTFTDLVTWDGRRMAHGKVLSTPDDPSRAIIEGLRRLGLDGRDALVVHGTTVGTNAVLEGKGARVAYVTSAGFGDVLSLGRQNRRQVYRLEQPAFPPPVPDALCLEVSTRCDAGGALLARAGDGELAALAERLDALGVEAVAVNLLFAFLCPEEERRIRAAIGDGRFVSLASEVLPEIREYERGIATWLNAAVGPVIERYLARLRSGAPRARIAVMQSSGTTVAAEQAAAGAVRLLLSGPAGGIAAARLLGRVTDRERLLTLDMGGTSTDVSLLAGDIPLTSDSTIAGWPLTVPSVDIHTIGAGGGSIARVDEGGMLLVGPASAGASPGPACYGKGGGAVTVTDANLVLGRIPSDTLLGGYLPLDAGAADAAVDRLADRLRCDRVEAARGVIRLANEHMARALRVMSVERGHDPRDYALVCFGGAGGLHACDLAELLGMRTVLLPALAGVLSAQGMLASQPGRDLSHAVLEPLEAQDPATLSDRFRSMEQEAAEALAAEGVGQGAIEFRRRWELRYVGQSATIVLDPERNPFPPGGAETGFGNLAEAFHEAHEMAAGHRLSRPVELVNLRLSARGPAPMTHLERAAPDRSADAGEARQAFVSDLNREVPVLAREGIAAGEAVAGPAIVTDRAATAWLAPGWRATADDWGNLLLERAAEATA